MNKAISIFILLLVFTTINCSNEEEFMARGTVQFIQLEGGFYGIVGDDNKQYEPKNLPKEYEQDGLKVEFNYKKAEGGASIYMWGEIIEILQIRKL